jgi:hypothetical protein
VVVEGLFRSRRGGCCGLKAAVLAGLPCTIDRPTRRALGLSHARFSLRQVRVGTPLKEGSDVSVAPASLTQVASDDRGRLNALTGPLGGVGLQTRVTRLLIKSSS